MLSSISNCDSIGDAIANSSQALSSIPSSESTSIRLFIHDVDSNDEPEIFETMDAVNGHDLLISLFGEDTEFSLRYKDGHYLCLDKSLKDQGVHDGDDLYSIFFFYYFIPSHSHPWQEGKCSHQNPLPIQKSASGIGMHSEHVSLRCTESILVQ